MQIISDPTASGSTTLINIHLNTFFPFTDGPGESASDIFRAEETEDTLAGVLEQESEPEETNCADLNSIMPFMGPPNFNSFALSLKCSQIV